jgi:hypothetical protein
VIVFPQESISFPSISNEESNYAQFAVFSMDRPNLKLTKLKSSKPDLIVVESKAMTSKQMESLQLEGGQSVIVEIKPGMPVGRFQEELVIQTDHPSQPELKIPIMGHVTGPITPVPGIVRMPNVSGRDGATSELTLLVRGRRTTRFEVTHKPEKVQVDIAPEQSPDRKGGYRVRVTVPAGTAPGKVEGEIILKTDHPKVSELKIPVSIFVAR